MIITAQPYKKLKELELAYSAKPIKDWLIILDNKKIHYVIIRFYSFFVFMIFLFKSFLVFFFIWF
tara:strand:+ start:3218 stop:3412 length:195 start_codon:yes stop_codon:yes gene_type:complete